MGDADATPLLEVGQVTKQFPGVKALQDVDLTLNRGEVLAVIGENGAGKSTLMKILAGVQPLDTGEIRIDGKIVQLVSVEAALSQGIALIHQELNLADNLDVGANIFLGREPRRFGLIDHERVHRESQQFLEMVGLAVDSATLVKELTVGSTLYLPVLHPEALFYVGDPHSAQGDGEVSGTAIEQSLSGRFRFVLHTDRSIAGPWAENDTHYVMMGIDLDLDRALQKAVDAVVAFLVAEKGLTPTKAVSLASIAVNFHVAEAVDFTQLVTGKIPKHIFR